jgi:hypothetical protein
LKFKNPLIRTWDNHSGHFLITGQTHPDEKYPGSNEHDDHRKRNGWNSDKGGNHSKKKLENSNPDVGIPLLTPNTGQQAFAGFGSGRYRVTWSNLSPLGLNLFSRFSSSGKTRIASIHFIISHYMVYD